MNIYIKVGSITNAQRAKAVLMKNSILSEIKRTVEPKPGDGCGYEIKIKSTDRAKTLKLFENNGIRVLGEETE